MPPHTLEGATLGEKHKSFNKLVQDAITNKEILNKIHSDENDIENLLKIDIACNTRNVDYIIEVLKCEDMLYASRAINKSTWLITGQQYAQIINPEYLHTELFPYMLTKAITKLLLHIRLNLKDETRNESFYNYLKDQGNDANMWLLNCSIPFIDNIIQNERHISLKLYKRLCKRSVKFLPYYAKVNEGYESRPLQAVLFLLKSNTEEYLNILDKSMDYWLPPFGKKYTEIVMKRCAHRILDNFERFKNVICFSTIAKHLKKEDIKHFLFKHMKNKETKNDFCIFNNLKHFIDNMPQEDRFEFVKKVYIEKSQTTIPPEPSDQDACSADEKYVIPSCTPNSYQWYLFAPFNVAFAELKKSIRAERSPIERCAIMSVLITCARNKPHDIKTILQYYYDKLRNEPFKFKIQFINDVISQMTTHEFDKDTWEILDSLFHTLEVYIESDNNVQSCIKSIIVYKVLHNEIVPDIIEKKFQFDTLEKNKHQLKEEQQNKIFAYLLNFISTKIKNKSISSEADFDDAVLLLKDAIKLLSDWKKDLKNYDFVCKKVQELLKKKMENSWKTNISSLYNLNKSYRKYMFEESLLLYPGQEVCINALKHEPELLTRYKEVVSSLITDNTVCLRHLLAKLRVYWPCTLAQQWSDTYIKQMNRSTGHKATVQGLFVLLPTNQLLDIAKKYVPEDSKIDWNEIDQIEFSLRKNIANNLYKARPLISLDTVLCYAKGDYLQFVVPSLNAIFYNISKVQSREYMSKLLKEPVSLQKYGVHLAFTKLNYDELLPIFSDIWQGTTNVTIRTHIFVYTYNILCRVKNSDVAKEVLDSLCTFIDNMALHENKVIFNKLVNVDKVQTCVQGQFYMKSYKFLTSLPPAANAESYINSLVKYAPNIMNLLDNDFVADKLLSPINEIISTPSCQFIDIMSAYVLHGKTEEEQCERFRRVLSPGLELAFLSWNIIKDNDYIYKQNIDDLLGVLTCDLRRYLSLRQIIVPVKLFTEIKILMEQKISIEENYSRITSWKITCEYVKLISENRDLFCDPRLNNISRSDCLHYWLPEDVEQVWKILHSKISPKMGFVIVKILREHTERFFSTICWLFRSALSRFFTNLNLPYNLFKMEILKHMLLNDTFVPSYLVVCDEVPQYARDEEAKIRIEIRQILLAHPSLEVRMHCHRVLGDIADPTS